MNGGEAHVRDSNFKETVYRMLNHNYLEEGNIVPSSFYSSLFSMCKWRKLILRFVLIYSETLVSSDCTTAISHRHTSKVPPSSISSEEDNSNGPIAICDQKKTLGLLDVAAAHYCSTFIYHVTGWWASLLERLMAHLHPTNHSCPQSNVCRARGRCSERVKCLSCAGRYQLNRKRCLPLRAVMMMMMTMCVRVRKCVAIKQVLRPYR